MRRHRVEAEIHLSLRRVVLVGSLWITSLTVLLAMALLMQDPVPWPSVRLNLVAAGVSFGAVLLGWRRHWKLASNLLVWGTWVAAVTVVAATGGVQSSSVLADRKSTRLNSSHLVISYAVFCLKKKTLTISPTLTPLLPRTKSDFSTPIHHPTPAKSPTYLAHTSHPSPPPTTDRSLSPLPPTAS